MISDVLFESCTEIQRYLDSGIYKDAIKGRIESLVKEMKSVQLVLDTPPTEMQEKKKNVVSPALPLSSPAGGMLPEGVGYTDTHHGQMVRQLKQFTGIHGRQFIIDCMNGKEDKYINQHQEKQVVEPLAKWLRLLASKT